MKVFSKPGVLQFVSCINILENVLVTSFVLDNACTDLYQAGKGLKCRACEAGTYVDEQCSEPNGSSKCSPCPPGHFQPNCTTAFSCEPCSDCRKHGAIVEEWCTDQRQTKCVCPEGKFFKKETQTEGLCLDLTVCQHDEIEVQKGTRWQDTVCDKAPTEVPKTVTTKRGINDTSNETEAIVAVVVSVIALAVAVVVILWVCRWKNMLCFKTRGPDGSNSGGNETPGTNEHFSEVNGIERVRDSVANGHVRGEINNFNPQYPINTDEPPQTSVINTGPPMNEGRDVQHRRSGDFSHHSFPQDNFGEQELGTQDGTNYSSIVTLDFHPDDLQAPSPRRVAQESKANYRNLHSITDNTARVGGVRPVHSNETLSI